MLGACRNGCPFQNSHGGEHARSDLATLKSEPCVVIIALAAGLVFGRRLLALIFGRWEPQNCLMSPGGTETQIVALVLVIVHRFVKDVVGGQRS